jgi:hypothetical protein
MDALQQVVAALSLGNLYILWKASSLWVKLKAGLFLVVSGLLYTLWYLPTLVLQLQIVDQNVIRTSLLVRDIFVSLIETTSAGMIWVILLAVNLLISVTGTRLRVLYRTRTALVVLFWTVTGYIVYAIFIEAGGSLEALLPLLIPLALSVVSRGEHVLEELRW